jgi:redox-sensitive bicupin YhaK (pirin superfamily)
MAVSPFLLLDYVGPAQFAPSDEPRGVGPHPHRGFETVTIVYSGEVEHRDSTGGGGRIGPGSVQWMTAASGVVHEEMHGREFTKRGGNLEIVQLWINLPAKDKAGAPRYQSLGVADIPEVPLPKGAGTARVIAGRLCGVAGPARTVTPINLWDVRLNADGFAEFAVPYGHKTLVFVLKGEIELAGGEMLSDFGLALFDPRGNSIVLTAQYNAKLLIIDGKPINEPVVAYGPFVMNTQAEIEQAIDDYRNGRMGQIDS